jgi:hypothetical protein
VKKSKIELKAMKIFLEKFLAISVSKIKL